MSPLPLAGITVCELGHSVAAPFAAQVLGDLGASVMKIEKPGGDDARRWGPPFWEGESAIFQTLRTEVPSYAVRQRVRPGITGQAQITLHYDTCVDDVRKKVAADLEYISKQSLLEDLRIMALTAPVVIFRKGGW